LPPVEEETFLIGGVLFYKKTFFSV